MRRSVCDLFSGQMITVSAETGIENKMTCLETRKGGVSSLQPWQAALLSVEREREKVRKRGSGVRGEIETEIGKKNDYVL